MWCQHNGLVPINSQLRLLTMSSKANNDLTVGCSSNANSNIFEAWCGVDARYSWSTPNTLIYRRVRLSEKTETSFALLSRMHVCRWKVKYRQKLMLCGEIKKRVNRLLVIWQGQGRRPVLKSRSRTKKDPDEKTDAWRYEKQFHEFEWLETRRERWAGALIK